MVYTETKENSRRAAIQSRLEVEEEQLYNVIQWVLDEYHNIDLDTDTIKDVIEVYLEVSQDSDSKRREG